MTTKATPTDLTWDDIQGLLDQTSRNHMCRVAVYLNVSPIARIVFGHISVLADDAFREARVIHYRFIDDEATASALHLTTDQVRAGLSELVSYNILTFVAMEGSFDVAYTITYPEQWRVAIDEWERSRADESEA